MMFDVCGKKFSEMHSNATTWIKRIVFGYACVAIKANLGSTHVLCSHGNNPGST